MVYESRDTQCLIICSFFQLMQIYIVNIIQGGKGIQANQRPNEDYENISSIKKVAVVTEEALEQDKRWRRIQMNSHENVPYSMFVFFATYFAINTDATSLTFIITLSLFTLSRFAYLISYAKSLQPQRTICFFGAQLASIACGITGIIAAFDDSKSNGL